MFRRELVRVAFAAALVAVGGALSLSCGGGGGGGTPVPPGLTADFTPENLAPGADNVSLQEGTISGANFNVRVAATDVNDFFGAAFSVTFPSTSVQFLSMDDSGSFLRDGGFPAGSLFFEADASTPGTVRVSATRLNAGTNSGVSVTGTRDLVVLRFRATAAVTNGVLAFAALNREVRSSVQPPPEGQPIAVGWLGGAVTAN